MTTMKMKRQSRQVNFCNVWTRFLRECRQNGIKMNQTIASEKLGIKRSTFSDSIQNGPSDAVLLRFILFTGVKPEEIEPSLSAITPFKKAANA